MFHSSTQQANTYITYQRMRNYSIFDNNNNNCLERNKTKKISSSTLSNNALPNFPFFIFVFSKRRPLRNKASNEKFFHSSSYLFFSPSNILRLGQFRLERERRMLVESEIIGSLDSSFEPPILSRILEIFLQGWQ